MTDSRSSHSTAGKNESASRLAQHLREQPQDLIDARRLMRDFHVSAEDFTYVLTQIDHPTSSDE